MGTRNELLEAVAARYRAATQAEKGRILTEFAEISGYHRKHAERLLRREQVMVARNPGPDGEFMTKLCERLLLFSGKRPTGSAGSG